MRAPAGKIVAPLFPEGMTWINVAMLRMDQQHGRPVLVEFFDVCRVSSVRTAPYVNAWAAKYPELCVVSVHAAGYPPSRDEAVVRAGVERLGIEHAVGIDHHLELWRLYGNEGWPARYLWDRDLRLFELHYGEGAYRETEEAIQELLGVSQELVAPVRPEDEPSAMLVVPTAEQEGAYSGPYEAGAVWVVAEGAGALTVNGAEHPISHAGAHQLIEHGVHTEGVLSLQPGEGVTVHATCFTPGLAP